MCVEPISHSDVCLGFSDLFIGQLVKESWEVGKLDVVKERFSDIGINLKFKDEKKNKTKGPPIPHTLPGYSCLNFLNNFEITNGISKFSFFP